MEVSLNRGTPNNHPFLDGIFPLKPPSYWGTLHDCGNPHMLVGGFKHYFFSIIYGIFLPILIFFKMVKTTNQYVLRYAWLPDWEFEHLRILAERGGSSLCGFNFPWRWCPTQLWPFIIVITCYNWLPVYSINGIIRYILQMRLQVRITGKGHTCSSPRRWFITLLFGFMLMKAIAWLENPLALLNVPPIIEPRGSCYY